MWIRYFFFALLFALPVAAAPVLKIPKAQPGAEVGHDYYAQLLQMALIKGAGTKVPPTLHETGPMEQARATHELNRGQIIDVYWMGTNIEREQKLRAIRIPLDRGLIGYRRFIIRADRKAEFDAIKTGVDLKSLLACQGLEWPDSDIMRTSALRVTEVTAFEGLFQQVVAGRCDYFPRGFYEAAPEVNARKKTYPELMEYQGVVLHYPFAVYFFVRHGNEELAQWIERGLEVLIDDGGFLAHMKRHPHTSHVFPLNKAAMPLRTIHIPNPFLPADTNYANARYWFQPTDFSATVRSAGTARLASPPADDASPR